MKERTLAKTLARYEQAPHLVFWETTKACSLACRHCRASAMKTALPGELSHDEGIALLEQIAAMPAPRPIVVFTGGDCFEREDLFDLVSHATESGLRVGVAPSVTPRLTRDAMAGLYERGVRSVSISLDGSNAESHDSLRGIPGHFDDTLAALAMLVEMGFRLQVNTTVMRRNAHELAEIAQLLENVGVAIWEVFFLVGVGRGAQIEEVSAEDAEDVCHFLVDVANRGMTVRTVEAPFFRRVQAERLELASDDPASAFSLGNLYRELSAQLGERMSDVRGHSATLATGDGRGIVFVGFDGAVHASGFLPVTLGNVREQPLGEIYTDSELLTSLRAGDLHGACGRCDYSRLCGGSRARAYSRTGDVLGDDPACVRTRARRVQLAAR